MEAEKRKQAHQSDVVSGRQKQKKPRDDDGAVKEEEVEEFFAILKRMHVAVRQFKHAHGAGRKLGDGGGSRLRAMFESNEELKLGPRRGEGVEEMGLDLNEDPDLETDPSQMGF